MNCEQMTVLLSAWLDGEVTPQEERQMQEHLEQCAQCRALFEQLKALHTSFSDLEEIPAPADFTETVMARVKAEPKVVPLFKRRAVRSVVSVAACALLCIGFVRVATDMGFDKTAQAAPEAAAPAPESSEPEAAAYDAESYEMPAAPAPESPAEYSKVGATEMAPDMAPAEPAEPSAPAAPAPPEAVTGEGGASGHQQDALRTQTAQIILRELPGELESILGVVQWEQRISDGAACAPLTGEQAEKLLALIDAGELSGEYEIPTGDEDMDWVLVYLPA